MARRTAIAAVGEEETQPSSLADSMLRGIGLKYVDLKTVAARVAHQDCNTAEVKLRGFHARRSQLSADEAPKKRMRAFSGGGARGQCAKSSGSSGSALKEPSSSDFAHRVQTITRRAGATTP